MLHHPWDLGFLFLVYMSWFNVPDEETKLVCFSFPLPFWSELAQSMYVSLASSLITPLHFFAALDNC